MLQTHRDSSVLQDLVVPNTSSSIVHGQGIPTIQPRNESTYFGSSYVTGSSQVNS